MAPVQRLFRAAVFILLIFGAGCAALEPYFQLKRPIGERSTASGPSAPQTQVRLSVALAPPLSGPLEPYGRALVAGAEEAAKRLGGFDLLVFDGLGRDIESKIASLTEDCGLVLGPASPDAALKLAQTGALADRRFFGLMQAVPERLVEGADLWRFFPSGLDQARTLAETVVERHGRRVGIVHPTDAYGQRMTDLFAYEAGRAGLTIPWTKSFSPDDPDSLFRTAAWVARHNDGTTAIFFPDVFDRAESFASALTYFQAEGATLFGPSLWGQTKDERMNVPEDWRTRFVYVQAVPAGRGETAETELFRSLGRDFIALAAALGPERRGPVQADFNVRLAKAAKSLSWTAGPIEYDASGKARQRLFPTTP